MRSTKLSLLFTLILGVFAPTYSQSQNSVGVPLMVTGPGLGGGPRVRLWEAFNQTSPNLVDFFAFTPEPFNVDPGFRGGTRVAFCDINGDNNPDIIVFPGYNGGPRLQAYDGAKAKSRKVKLLMNMMVYEDDFRGGGWVACADFNNDGYGDIITSAGTDGGSRIRVFSGNVLTQQFPPNAILAGNSDAPPLRAARMADFFAYVGPSGDVGSGRFGVTIAAGDVNRDGVPDIVTGTNLGGGPHVQVVNGAKIRNGALLGGQLPSTFDFTLFSFMAFHPALRKGVYVAAADVDGDGYADIIAGAPSSTFDSSGKVLIRSEGMLRVFSGKWFTDRYTGNGAPPDCIHYQNEYDSGLSATLRPNYALPNPRCLVAQFFPYEEQFTGSIYVSGGDLDGDGKAEVVTTAGETGGPRTSMFRGAQLLADVAAHANLPDLPRRPTASADFFAYEDYFRGGAHSAVTMFYPIFGVGK